ncbi:acyl-CoA N-acyltransferase [Mycena amicta]|nr:acyl-CoA N-acyltransferase [Mycena amicta]
MPPLFSLQIVFKLATDSNTRFRRGQLTASRHTHRKRRLQTSQHDTTQQLTSDQIVRMWGPLPARWRRTSHGWQLSASDCRYRRSGSRPSASFKTPEQNKKSDSAITVRSTSLTSELGTWASDCRTVFPLLRRIPFSQTTQSRLGIALCVVGATLIFSIRGAIRHYLRRFCDDALKADMRDIEEWYCKPGGGFWVAVRPREAIGNGIGSVKAGEEEDEEVLGYVGLEYQPISPPSPLRDPTTTAEIRRMIVAEAHRRKGLANALMHAALAHADAISHPRLDYVFLGTSDLQPAAQTLYERLGFITVREEVIGNWAGTTVLREYRKIGRVGPEDGVEG